jgi:hypothetical protein
MKDKDLRPQEEAIAIEVAKGKPDYKAYQAITGCSYETARANTATYMKANPQIKARAIDIIQQQSGLQLQDALNVVKDGMTAEYINKYGRQPNHIARLEHAKVLLRLYGELREQDTKSITLSQTNIHIDIDLDKLSSILTEVKSMNEHCEDISDGEIVREVKPDSIT